MKIRNFKVKTIIAEHLAKDMDFLLFLCRVHNV
jgi:hypothetical protein